MSFLAWLMLIYGALLALTVAAFLSGKKGIGFALAGLIVLGIVVLGYLWLTSPM